MASYNRTMRRALERGKKPEQVKSYRTFHESRAAVYQRPQITLFRNSISRGGDMRQEEIR